MGDPARLYGLKAVVFSGGSGIGEANARTLMKHGATVLAVDTKNSGAEQHFARVRGITGMSANLLDPEQLAQVIAEAVDLLGGVDILVNEFPLPQDAPLKNGDDRLATLLKQRATLIMASCRAALPHLKKSPQGRIINMGMLRSCFAADAGEACRKSEQDLANLTRALGVETGEFGINANYVQPGGVMTPDSREMFRKTPELRDHCIRSSAARRLGEPVDVSKVVLFLASDDSVFVSGTGIAADGGRAQD